MNDMETTTPPFLLRRTALLGGALLMLAAGAFVLGHHQTSFAADTEVPKGPPPLVVKTALVSKETVAQARTGVGTVLPMASVTVRTRIDGQLDRVDFKEGQDVKAGQVLAHIDPRTYQAQLDQVEAQKAKDQVLLANAQADLARYTQLIKDEATTQQTLDTQRALVAQLQATLKTDDAQINLARVQMSYTTIAAPISGRIGARLVDAGNIVHAADAGGLLVINQIDPIALQFTLPESAFQAVNRSINSSKAPGKKPLKVEAVDRSTRQVLAVGELILVNNQIDVATGTIALKARFANAEHKLWPGQTIEARITLGEMSDALTIPAPAVQRSQSGFFAYVVDADNKVRVQPIKVLQNENGKAVIESGLAAGDRVVVDGQYRLVPGASVTEAKAVPAPGQAASSPSAAASGAKP